MERKEDKCGCAQCGCKYQIDTLTAAQALELITDSSTSWRRRRWISVVKERLEYLEEIKLKYDQVYQDRCEGAYVEVSILKEVERRKV
jgi:hypothetical protein